MEKVSSLVSRDISNYLTNRKTWVMIINVKDYGAKGDGTTDDTSSIQSAFNAAATSAGVVVFPEPDVHYRITQKITVKASAIGFGNRPMIKLDAGIQTGGVQGVNSNYHVFEINLQQNIVIQNLKLNGGWTGTSWTVFTSGEWEYPIQILASSYIYIDQCTLTNSKGDGIYIDCEDPWKLTTGTTNSDHIYITRCVIENVFRNTISIITGTNIYIEENYLDSTSCYYSSIDIEPEARSVETGNIHIIGNRYNGYVGEFARIQSARGPIDGVIVKDNVGIVRAVTIQSGVSGSKSKNISLVNNRINQASEAVMNAVVARDFTAISPKNFAYKKGQHLFWLEQTENVTIENNTISAGFTGTNAEIESFNCSRLKDCTRTKVKNNNFLGTHTPSFNLRFEGSNVNTEIVENYFGATNFETIFAIGTWQYLTVDGNTFSSVGRNGLAFGFGGATGTPRDYVEITNNTIVDGGSATSAMAFLGTSVANTLLNHIIDNNIYIGFSSTAAANNAVLQFRHTPESVGKKISYESAAPTDRDWVVGDIVYNTAPAAGGKIGWVCVTAGTPGTWKEFGEIDA